MASNVTDVNIRNAAETIAALKSFDTDASKALAKGLRKAVRPLVRKAQQDVPSPALSQWEAYPWIETRSGRNKKITERDLRWDTNRVRRGITVTIGGKRARGRMVSNLVGIRSGNAAGAIYELAGARTAGNKLDVSLRKAGHGEQPRLVLKQDTPANRAAVQRDVTAAMREAEREIQRHLDRMR